LERGYIDAADRRLTQLTFTRRGQLARAGKSAGGEPAGSGRQSNDFDYTNRFNRRRSDSQPIEPTF
jgi:hypothetical protein